MFATVGVGAIGPIGMMPSIIVARCNGSSVSAAVSVS